MLTPSQRKKVAEAVTGQRWRVVDFHPELKVVLAEFEQGAYWPVLWEPNDRHYRALVSKIAGLIEARANWEPTVGWLLRFNKLLCENSVEGLESLAYELMEAE